MSHAKYQAAPIGVPPLGINSKTIGSTLRQVDERRQYGGISERRPTDRNVRTVVQLNTQTNAQFGASINLLRLDYIRSVLTTGKGTRKSDKRNSTSCLAMGLP